MSQNLVLCGLWAIGLGLAVVLPAAGQQTIVEVVIDEDQVLAKEDLIVAVKITNFSGRILRFGQDNEWLRFSVTTEQDRPVERLGTAPVDGEFTVESSKVATRRVNIAPYFDLGRPGSYRVIATVKFAELNFEQTSLPRPFSVMSGRKLWEQVFGLPGTGETRKYALLQSTHKERLMLYARLSSPDDHQIFRTLPISTMTSVSQPEPQIDSLGQLHVLNQYGARAFHHCVIASRGEMVLRETYEYGPGRPALRADEHGLIQVAGGVRKISQLDVPKPGSESSRAE